MPRPSFPDRQGRRQPAPQAVRQRLPALGPNGLPVQRVPAEQFIRAAAGSISHRGKSQVGDKTMVDTLVPALSTLAAEAEGDERSAWDKTVAAAEQGMTSTIPLVARKGRASYLGERSAGHQDPGATSTYLFLNSLRAAALGEP